MEKIKFMAILVAFLIYNNASAKKTKIGDDKITKRSPVSFDVNLGLLNKIRCKIEYRIKNNQAIQLSCSRHYGFVNPGAQTYLEYRQYTKKKERIENYVYGKAGYGKSFTFGGNYAIFGAGFGQKINLGKKQAFFIQFSEGLKFCPTISGDVEGEPGSGFRGLFYILGPGAVIELNISFGYRF